jgi:hypothetical protein
MNQISIGVAILDIEDPIDARLNQMQMLNPQLGQLSSQVTYVYVVLVGWILHVHRQVRTPRTKTYADAADTDLFNNKFNDLNSIARTLLYRVSPPISTLIGDVLYKLIDQSNLS